MPEKSYPWQQALGKSPEETQAAWGEPGKKETGRYDTFDPRVIYFQSAGKTGFLLFAWSGNPSPAPYTLFDAVVKPVQPGEKVTSRKYLDYVGAPLASWERLVGKPQRVDKARRYFSSDGPASPMIQTRHYRHGGRAVSAFTCTPPNGGAARVYLLKLPLKAGETPQAAARAAGADLRKMVREPVRQYTRDARDRYKAKTGQAQFVMLVYPFAGEAEGVTVSYNTERGAGLRGAVLNAKLPAGFSWEQTARTFGIQRSDFKTGEVSVQGTSASLADGPLGAKLTYDRYTSDGAEQSRFLDITLD